MTCPADARLLIVTSVRAVALTPVFAVFALTALAISLADALALIAMSVVPVGPETVRVWAVTPLPLIVPRSVPDAIAAAPTCATLEAVFAPISVALALPMPKLIVWLAYAPTWNCWPVKDPSSRFLPLN